MPGSKIMSDFVSKRLPSIRGYVCDSGVVNLSRPACIPANGLDGAEASDAAR